MPILSALPFRRFFSACCCRWRSCDHRAPAEAAVRAAVGKPLQEAQSLAAAGNYRAAHGQGQPGRKCRRTDAAKRAAVIAQMKAYISSKSNATGGKGKLSADYRAGHWSAVIADANSMRGQLDANDMAAVATAYYKMGNYPGCVRYIRTHFGNGASDTVLKIQMACAFSAGDDDAQTSALEQLVARNGTPEYWGQLLKAAERTRGLKDHQTLDIYRIKLRTGTMNGAQDYTLLAKLALAARLSSRSDGCATEGRRTPSCFRATAPRA